MEDSPVPHWQLVGTESGATLTISGDWVARSGAIPEFPANGLPHGRGGGTLSFDLARLGRWDSGLIAFLWDVRRSARAAALAIDNTALPDAVRKLLGLLADQQSEPMRTPAARRYRLLEWLGGGTVNLVTEAGILSALLGNVVMRGWWAVLGRARMRRIDLLANIRDAGPSALIIVSVVNFLIGAILAFVGAVQLRKFAADIYVANLVGLAVVREMAAVMTAIIMAGRTGGAYAARIATMQGNEEIDALTVFGIPISDYILLPAILSLVVAMPLLYLYGCLIGMVGGFAVSIAMLNITATGYLHQTMRAVAFNQFVFGFIKSIAFAMLIGLTSCRIGLKAGRSAADVGVAATRAVVIGIVGVIALDAIFAVLANVLGI